MHDFGTVPKICNGWNLCKWPECGFQALDPIFLDFIILLDLSHYSGENEVLFVKIGARVLNLWQVHLLGLSGPNEVSNPKPHGQNIF